MKVYLLCETKLDYLEIWEYITVVGVFVSKKAAQDRANELKLEEYIIIMRKVEI